MSLYLPNPKFLVQTGNVDYYHWNYQFPIKYVQRFRFKAILELMGNQMYGRLLEAGTGSGIFLPELAKHCCQLYACDIHDKMQAVERLSQLTSIKVKLRQCKLEDTGYPDDFFDVIVAVSVLEFVENLGQCIKEVKRILKPDGIFLSICPQQSAVLDFILGLLTRRTPEEEFGASRSKVSKALEAQFNVSAKKVFPLIIGRIFPVYIYYKLTI